MSRDIRSYFTTLSKKTNPTPNVKNENAKKRSVTSLDSSNDDIIPDTPQEKKVKTSKDHSKNKRRRIIAISSDSDTENDTFKKAKSKAKPVPKSKEKSQTSEAPKSQEKQKTHSNENKTKKPSPSDTEPVRKKINLFDMFGNEPIMQTKVVKRKNTNTELDIHADDDFDKTLLELDEEELLRAAATSSKNNVQSVANTTTSSDEFSTKPKPPRKSKTPDKTVVTPAKNQQSDDEKAKDKTSARKRKASETEDSGMDPDQERFEKKRYSAMLYQKYLSRGGPANPGSKWIPKGKPECLKGLCFIITGVLQSLQRDEAQNLIIEHGGRCIQSVSGKVNYMVLGEDAGPSKLEKAKSLGVQMISEDELIDLICVKSNIKNKNTTDEDTTEVEIKKEKTPEKKEVKKEEKSKSTTKKEDKKHTSSDKPNLKKLQNNTTKVSSKEENVAKTDVIEVEDEDEIPSVTKKQSPVTKDNFYGKPKDIKHVMKKDTHIIKKEFNKEIKKGIKKEIKKESLDNLPWVDKYKPTEIDKIIGQQGDRSNVKKLMHWLQNWYKNHNGKTKLTKPSPWAKNDDGGFFKASLLSGFPGVGKTTTATLVSKELGFDVVEFNASDTRNKKMVHQEIAQILKTTSLAGYFADGSTPSKKHVLLMDEVDGMSGNEDRGGIQELITLIKNSNIPIICMCNDRQHQKIRTLANYCFDLRFTKPRLEQVRGAMMSICFKENINISAEALTQIIQGAGMDIRQTLNNLSMWTSKDNVLSKEMAKSKAKMAEKDVKLGPWEVIRKVFSEDEHKNMTFIDKSKLFFYDYSIGPLFVQENYLKVVPHCPKKEHLERFAKAADSISLGDLVDSKIRTNQSWQLLEMQAMYASVFPGQYLEGHFGGQIDFPGWLGKNSKGNKFKRMLSELHGHMRTCVSGNIDAVNLDYLPHIRDAIIRPLVKGNASGIPQAITVMKDYHLLRDDLNNIIELSHWPKTKDLFNSVDSKVKAAFTRAYNKDNFLLPYATAAGPVKKKRGAGVDDNEEYGECEEENTAGTDEENEDDISQDAMIKAKKPTAAKTKTESKPSTTKGKASASGRSRKGAK